MAWQASWSSWQAPSQPPPGPWKCQCGYENAAYRYRCKGCKTLDVNRKAWTVQQQSAGLAPPPPSGRAQSRRRGGRSQDPAPSPSPDAAEPGPTATVDKKIQALEKSIRDLEAAGLDPATLKTELTKTKLERAATIPPGHRLESAKARINKCTKALEDAQSKIVAATERRDRCQRDLQEAEGELRDIERDLATRPHPSDPDALLRVVQDINAMTIGMPSDQAAAAAAALPPELIHLLGQLRSAAAPPPTAAPTAGDHGGAGLPAGTAAAAPPAPAGGGGTLAAPATPGNGGTAAGTPVHPENEDMRDAAALALELRNLPPAQHADAIAKGLKRTRTRSRSRDPTADGSGGGGGTGGAAAGVGGALLALPPA